MSDVETRLRADADNATGRRGAVPDLDTMLRAATSRPTRARLAVPAAAVAVIVAGAALGLTIAQAGPGADPTRVSKRPAATSDPDRARIEPAPAGTVLGALTVPHSAAPKELDIIMRGAPAPTASTCYLHVPRIVETATEVRVTPQLWTSPRDVKVSGVSGPGSGAASSAQLRAATSTCTALPGPLAASIRELNRPLGSRRLVDTSTGKDIPVFRTAPPQHADVPTGYHSDGVGRGPMGAETLDSRPGALGPLALGSFYSAGPGQHRMTIAVVSASSGALYPGARVVDRDVVHGRPATVTESAQLHCVTWTTAAGSGLQVCSDSRTAKGRPEFLSTAELLAVANSLR